MLPITSPCDQGEFFISKQNIITASPLRDLSVGYKDNNFFIQLPSGERKSVLPYDLSGGLEFTSSTDSLEKVLEIGKIYLTTIGEDYKLRLGVSGKGGGPICGAIAYWGTKAVIYGGIAGAVGTVTGGIAGGAVGGAITGIAGGGALAGAVGGAAGQVAAGSAVAVAETTAAIGGTLGIAGTIAAIEGTATTVSMFFTALPFCP